MKGKAVQGQARLRKARQGCARPDKAMWCHVRLEEGQVTSWGYRRPNEALRGPKRPYEARLDQSYGRKCETMWGQARPWWAMQSYGRLYEAMWGHVSPSKGMWFWARLFEVMWGQASPSEATWVWARPCKFRRGKWEAMLGQARQQG